jgi:glycosyltransferase involved in cell wall biosynthesis
MRIVIDTSCLLINPKSGLSEVVRNLVIKLPYVEKGNQFTLFYNYFRSLKNNPNYFFPGTINHELRLPRRIVYWLWKFDKSNSNSFVPKGDIYHSLHVQIPPSKRIKKILTVHDCRFLAFPDLYPPKAVEDYWQLMNISLKRSDMVVTVSNYTRQELMRHFSLSEERIRVIHNGFRPYISNGIKSEEMRFHFINKLDLPKVYLLFIGVLDPRKNLGRLIEALSILRDKTRHFPELVIAGTSPAKWAKSDLAKKAAKLGFLKYIHVAGVVEKEILFGITQRALALCYPSLYEGFGFPPLEAMSQGIPVLAGKNSSIPEITGDAACLVDPLSVDDILRGLQKIIFDNEYRQKLIKRGFGQINKFSWTQAAAEYIRLYKEVLG